MTDRWIAFAFWLWGAGDVTVNEVKRLKKIDFKFKIRALQFSRKARAAGIAQKRRTHTNWVKSPDTMYASPYRTAAIGRFDSVFYLTMTVSSFCWLDSCFSRGANTTRISSTLLIMEHWFTLPSCSWYRKVACCLSFLPGLQTRILWYEGWALVFSPSRQRQFFWPFVRNALVWYPTMFWLSLAGTLARAMLVASWNLVGSSMSGIGIIPRLLPCCFYDLQKHQ